MGNARTALLSYCLSTPEGRFILRIEDTDRERYVPGSVETLMESLRWLGLKWDEGPEVGGPCAPYVESERLDLYRAASRRLVERGAAYPCFCSRERLEDLRQAQRAAGLPTRYDRHCLGMSPEEVAESRLQGLPEVLRLLMPPGESRWEDLVLGPQRFDNQEIDDQILLKSDGFPTYHLAHVVDDHLMGITQVIRGVEWVPSTPKHLAVYAALGWTPPEMGHVPLVLGADRQKLSKRHGATAISDYRAMGYLPEALANFLAFLGWSPGTEDEIFALAELRSRMSFERLQASPAIFDQKRLDYLNGVWIRRLDVDDLAGRLASFVPEVSPAQLPAIAGMVQERIRRLDEVAGLVAFAFTEPEPNAAQVCGTAPKEQARGVLETVLGLLEAGNMQIMEPLRELAEREAPDGGKEQRTAVRRITRIARIAITGQEVTPPLDPSVALIGAERAAARVRRALEVLAA